MKNYSLQGRQSSSKVFCFSFCPFAGWWAPRNTQQPLNFTLGTNPVGRKRSRKGIWLPLSVSASGNWHEGQMSLWHGRTEVGTQSLEGKAYRMDLGLWWRKEERSCWFGSGACGCLGLGRSTKKEKFGAEHMGRVSPMRAFEHRDQGDLPFLRFSHCPPAASQVALPRSQGPEAFCLLGKLRAPPPTPLHRWEVLCNPSSPVWKSLKKPRPQLPACKTRKEARGTPE